MLELVERFESFLSFLPRLHKKVFAGCQALEQLNMTPSQFNTLQVVAHRPEWRMTDLSTRLHVSAGSLTTMMNRLIELELIERTRSTTDRRVVTVKLTDKGTTILQSGRDHMRSTLAAILATLPPADREELRVSLETMNGIMNKIV
ncbi:MAG: 5'-methylthioadenosine phosphorylase [Bacillota bacterium]|nr:MAG: 5'-methylthioadenosine phosphorylase [Bacillota bacterium]MBS3949900.1 MarR family transcriptional regulator [Peptococcaceae bacterium]